jgi:hypothetical protein
MNKIKVFTTTFSLALLCLAFQSIARADEWDKSTVVQVSGQVEVPGVNGPVVLDSGTYVFKLANIQSNRDIVTIFNTDETKLLATINAVPDYRNEPSEKPLIILGEASANTPPPIINWFYPGDNYGWDFVQQR